MSASIAAAVNTTPATKEAFHKAIGILWGTPCPSFEDRSPGGQWFQYSVRHPETGWAVLASTRTFGELVAHMHKVAEMRVLPEGTLVSAGRQFGYCEYDCSHHEQTFLLTTVGRVAHLEPHKD